MECFSGIGGMIRVGCKFTSVALKELNSEYLLRTSRSYPTLDDKSPYEYKNFYSRADRVDNVASAIFVALACICDDNL